MKRAPKRKQQRSDRGSEKRKHDIEQGNKLHQVLSLICLLESVLHFYMNTQTSVSTPKMVAEGVTEAQFQRVGAEI